MNHYEMYKIKDIKVYSKEDIRSIKLQKDPFSLKNSKIKAREFWTIRVGDSINYNYEVHFRKKIYLSYARAKEVAVKLALEVPNKKIYISHCEEVFKYEDDVLVGEYIDDLKEKF